VFSFPPDLLEVGMAEEVLDALMDVFNSANYRSLTLEEVAQQLQRRGVYQDITSLDAMKRVIDHFNNASAIYPFFPIGENQWGLESWLPKRRRRVRGKVQAVEPLHVGWETQHTLSPSRFEVERGTFPLRGQNPSRLIASMDEQQHEHPIVELRCYGSEKLFCAMTHDDRDNWVLEGMALQRWYKEMVFSQETKSGLLLRALIPLS